MKVLVAGATGALAVAETDLDGDGRVFSVMALDIAGALMARRDP